MSRFYQSIDISYQDTKYDGKYDSEYHGSVLVGVSFRDQKGLIVKSNKERFQWEEK